MPGSDRCLSDFKLELYIHGYFYDGTAFGELKKIQKVSERDLEEKPCLARDPNGDGPNMNIWRIRRFATIDAYQDQEKCTVFPDSVSSYTQLRSRPESGERF